LNRILCIPPSFSSLTKLPLQKLSIENLKRGFSSKGIFVRKEGLREGIERILND